MKFEDTYPSVPACCTGNCNQGRRCPVRSPAEAATEVGNEDPFDRPVSRWHWVKDLALLAIAIWILYALLEGSLS